MQIISETMNEPKNLTQDERNDFAVKLAEKFKKWDEDRDPQITTARKIMKEVYLNQSPRARKDWQSDIKLNSIYNIKEAKKAQLWSVMWSHITNSRVKPIDLHNAKEILYDMANYDTAGGTRNEVLKSVANQINNFLRSKNPAYKAPNDRFAMIKNIENELGGINSSTIGSKLMKYGSEGNKLSGLDQKLKNIDMILNPQDRFLQRTKDLVKSQAEVNNINKLINQSYERNPRLLSNINDTAREEALESLQKMTGVNFMDDLENVRAREALERLFPGQGGGSGSSQGFGNLLRTAIIGGTPAASLITGNPVALGGLGVISPKIMAKGTIKNLGEVYKRLGREMPDSVRRLLTPISIDSLYSGN